MKAKTAKDWINKGNEFSSAEKYNTAINCYEKAIKLDSGNAAAFTNLGLALTSRCEETNNMSLLDDAFRCHKIAVGLAPQNEKILFDYGIAVYISAKMKLADIDLTALKQDGAFREKLAFFEGHTTGMNDGPIFFIKGLVYLALKQIEDAKECFKKTGMNILKILNFLDIESREEIIKTNILHSLLDSNDDNFFNDVVEKFAQETATALSREQREAYKNVYILSVFIINLLHVGNQNEKYAKYENRVAHYRGRSVSEKLVSGKSALRLNAVNGAHDPTEGKVLLDFLYGDGYEEKRCLSNGTSNNDGYNAFAGCFTFGYDSLNQFRLYGKKENEEGTGVSLVFKDSFFNDVAKLGLKPAKTILRDTNNGIGIEEEKAALFRCIYVDPCPKTELPIVTVGQKEEYLFYREGVENNYDRNKIESAFKEYNKAIKEIITRVREEMTRLKKMIRDNDLDVALTGRLLINLRYLVKHVAFKEEQECRIVEIKAQKNDAKAYLEYSPKVADHIAKIYFGPKAEAIESFRDMLKDKGLNNIPCQRTTNPFV